MNFNKEEFKQAIPVTEVDNLAALVSIGTSVNHKYRLPEKPYLIADIELSCIATIGGVFVPVTAKTCILEFIASPFGNVQRVTKGLDITENVVIDSSVFDCFHLGHDVTFTYSTLPIYEKLKGLGAVLEDTYMHITITYITEF